MIPKFSALDFVSFYIEIPVMLVMYAAWLSFKRPLQELRVQDPAAQPLLLPQDVEVKRHSFHDLVDVDRVDLHADEYNEPDDEGVHGLAEGSV